MAERLNEGQLREIADKAAEMRIEETMRLAGSSNIDPQTLEMHTRDVEALANFEHGLRVALGDAEASLIMRSGTMIHFFHTSSPNFNKPNDEEGTQPRMMGH